jgi:hypothetical protein
VKHRQSSFKEGLFSHDEVPFIFSHPSAFPSGEKDAGHFVLHDPSIQEAKKKEGVGHPTPPS